MGNEQSNTRKPNYKICKIIDRDEHSDWIRCYLDDYVPYSDGDYKHMDFEKIPSVFTTTAFFFGYDYGRASLYRGRYIAIDIDMTKENRSGKNFSSYAVKEVGMETTNSDGKITFIEFVGGIAEVINKQREIRAMMAERDRYQSQIQEWHLEPPKK